MSDLKTGLNTHPCPNKQRFFRIGKLGGSFQLASDYWVDTSKEQHYLRTWFSLVTVSNAEGYAFLRLIVLRLKFCFYWITD